MIQSRTIGRRRGQGMTEYIIIVGLIAIGLVLAVGNFRDQIDKTIQGSDGNGGMVGETNRATQPFAANGGGSGGSSTGGSSSASGQDGRGRAVTNGRYADGTAYDPAIHGPLSGP